MYYFRYMTLIRKHPLLGLSTKDHRKQSFRIDRRKSVFVTTKVDNITKVEVPRLYSPLTNRYSTHSTSFSYRCRFRFSLSTWLMAKRQNRKDNRDCFFGFKFVLMTLKVLFHVKKSYREYTPSALSTLIKSIKSWMLWTRRILTLFQSWLSIILIVRQF